ncbi:MAG TPA: acyltransferase [Chitinophagales bacterium]|nr:acyltransferase [Chitinophagales bacterium]
MLDSIIRFFKIDIDYKNRIYGFDIMRGIGILIVVYAHGRSFMQYFPAFNNFISVIGFWLMDLFFVLSGYLIGMIVIKFYEKEKTFNLKTAYNFWIRRWFRTLPNYYLALFVTAILWTVSSENMFVKPFFYTHLLFLQTVTRPPGYFLMESWTLCIEEWFYLLFPVFLIFGNKLLAGNNNTHIKKNVFISILILFCIPFVLRIFLYTKQVDLEWMDSSRMVFFRLDTIATGIFMSWIAFYNKDLLSKYRLIFGILFLVFMSSYLYCFYTFILPNLINNSIESNFITHFGIFLLSNTACFCLTVYMKGVKNKSTNWFVKFITLISLISYSMYIFHRSVVFYLFDKFFKPTTILGNVSLFAAYLITTILLSMLVYKYFEHPMTELREKMKR